MTGPRRANDDLLDEASSILRGVLSRMRRRMEGWDIEQAAFGLEDPKVVEAKRREEDKPEAPSERHAFPGRPTWRDLFRRNWPDGKLPKRKRWRS